LILGFFGGQDEFSVFQRSYSLKHSVVRHATLCVVWINYKTSFVLIGYLSGE